MVGGSKKWLDSVGTTLDWNYTLVNQKLLKKKNLKPVNSLLPFDVKEVAQMILVKKVSIMVLKAGLVSSFVYMQFVFFIKSTPYLI
jgi:hypothetical protein